MSGPLEKFIVENREIFDTDVPDPRLWEKINERMNPDAEKSAPVRSIFLKRWMSIAAAVLLLIVTGAMYYSFYANKPLSSVATAIPQHKLTNNLPTAHPTTDSQARIDRDITDNKSKIIPDARVQEPSNPNSIESGIGDNKEMYYYAKLIELKHEELKTLEKDEPLLYRQFSGDVQKLDSVYHSLKIQLPNNSNREQVIEAMISNLQLQIGLLNKQLDIIKKIKHSKKSAYEKAYKSV
jgi:hypothetical protein